VLVKATVTVCVATGTGLGLTIAKRNIELNGGTIAVTSQRGVGTTVTMLLPIKM